MGRPGFRVTPEPWLDKGHIWRSQASRIQAWWSVPLLYGCAGQRPLRFYGDPHTEAILNAYFAAKTAVSFLPHGERLLRTAKNHPVLPESRASRNWMSRGVHQGLLDYRKTHGDKLGPPYSARGC